MQVRTRTFGITSSFQWSSAPQSRSGTFPPFEPPTSTSLHITMAPSILLLKTRSSPNDGYDDYFSANNYTPTFVPVLEHRFHTSNLAEVRELFASGAFNPEAENTKSTQINTYEHTVVPSKHYGGMIFTSQRAVEGFAHMIEEHGRMFHTRERISFKSQLGKKLTRYLHS